MRFVIATSFSKPEHLGEIAVAADQHGFDSVAIDSYGLTELLGRELDELGGREEGYLQKAQRRELGTMDWKSLNPRKIQV